MNSELSTLRRSTARITILFFSATALVLIFLFQQVDFLGWICQCETQRNTHFVVNKTFRVLMNDLCMLSIIHAWFYDRNVTRLAFWIQLIDTVVLLPFYLILKLAWEGDSEISSPLLSQLHRLIINPTLMILIFPAIYFQRLQTKKQK